MDLRGRSERERLSSVVADGVRTRYQGGTYECMWKEWALRVNLGGTAGSEVLSQLWDKAFLFFKIRFPFRKERSL